MEAVWLGGCGGSLRFKKTPANRLGLTGVGRSSKALSNGGRWSGFDDLADVSNLLRANEGSQGHRGWDAHSRVRTQLDFAITDCSAEANALPCHLEGVLIGLAHCNEVLADFPTIVDVLARFGSNDGYASGGVKARCFDLHDSVPISVRRQAKVCRRNGGTSPTPAQARGGNNRAENGRQKQGLWSARVACGGYAVDGLWSARLAGCVSV